MGKQGTYNKQPIGIKSEGMIGWAVYDLFVDGGEDYCIAGVIGETPRKYKLYWSPKRESSYFNYRGRRMYLADFIRS